jgi:hypothetical protein
MQATTAYAEARLRVFLPPALDTSTWLVLYVKFVGYASNFHIVSMCVSVDLLKIHRPTCIGKCRINLRNKCHAHKATDSSVTAARPTAKEKLNTHACHIILHYTKTFALHNLRNFLTSSHHCTTTEHAGVVSLP